MTPAPAVQFQLPFATNRNSAPPSRRRKFKSVTGESNPEKVRDKFQFSFRASTKNETTRSARPSTGELSDAKTRRFWESQRTNDEKLIARPPRLYHSGYAVW